MPGLPAFGRNLWCLLTQNVFIFLGIALQALILNLYLVALGYREDFIGLLQFAQTAAIGLAALPAGSLAPRLGPRRMLIVATGTLGSSFAAMALIESPVLLIAAAIVNGASMASIFVPMAPFLMDNSAPELRRVAFSANFAALSLASVVGSALGGQVPGLIGGGDLYGYRVALLMGAALTFLGIPPLLVADDRRVAESVVPTTPAAPGGRVTTERVDTLAMCAATILMSASTGLVVAFFNVYLRDQVHASTQTIGTIFAIASLAMAPASLVAPALSRRIGLVPTIALSRILCVPAIVALLFDPGLTIAALAYIGRSGFMSVGQPLDNAYMMELYEPRKRARISALRTLSWNGGWAVATALGGLAIVNLGYHPIFLAAALLMLGSVIVHYMVFQGRDTTPRA